jgi:hypothetical protein
MDFGRTPTGMLPLAPPQPIEPFLLGTIMQLLRRPHLIPQSATPALLKTGNPFIGSFSTDSRPSAKLSHTPSGSQS